MHVLQIKNTAIYRAEQGQTPILVGTVFRKRLGHTVKTFKSGASGKYLPIGKIHYVGGVSIKANLFI